MKIEIKPDFTRKRKLNHIWAFGGNTCHAPLLLRDDLLRHLEMAKRELGFKYVRCHGILSDGIGVVKEDGTHDFTKLNKVIDNLLALGLRPFMELSAMPGLYARNNKSVCHYIFRSSPPKDWNLWHTLIKSLILNLKRRYGLAELGKWYFEVWNEPDIAFWSGTRKEYFKLYDLAAKAIKEISPSLKVGGPATSKTAWIAEFADHILKPSEDYGLTAPRCDFISTHAYPSDLAFLDSAKGDVKLQNSNIMKELFGKARRVIDEKLGKDMPLICGEWNSSAGPYAFNHDECNNAAYIVKTMDELSEICRASLYWNISDIYEEGGFHFQPFHGGYGLISVNDIRKSSFNAFRFLNHLGKWRIPVEVPHNPVGFGCILTKKDSKHIMLAYYNLEPGIKQQKTLELDVRAFPDSISKAEISSILPCHGSSYEKWIESEKPDFATGKILSELENAALPARGYLNMKNQRLAIKLGTVLKIEF